MNKEIDATPLGFQELSEDVMARFLTEGPFDTPEKMFKDANSAFKSGYQIGHEMALFYDNYADERPASSDELIEIFKVGLFNGLRVGFDLVSNEKEANLENNGSPKKVKKCAYC